MESGCLGTGTTVPVWESVDVADAVAVGDAVTELVSDVVGDCEAPVDHDAVGDDVGVVDGVAVVLPDEEGVLLLDVVGVAVPDAVSDAEGDHDAERDGVGGGVALAVGDACARLAPQKLAESGRRFAQTMLPTPMTEHQLPQLHCSASEPDA
jgi:hypothetical protein